MVFPMLDFSKIEIFHFLRLSHSSTVILVQNGGSRLAVLGRLEFFQKSLRKIAGTKLRGTKSDTRISNVDAKERTQKKLSLI